jgi:hypothetical protein
MAKLVPLETGGSPLRWILKLIFPHLTLIVFTLVWLKRAQNTILLGPHLDLSMPLR